jgi:hypothetical protein
MAHAVDGRDAAFQVPGHFGRRDPVRQFIKFELLPEVLGQSRRTFSLYAVHMSSLSS